MLDQWNKIASNSIYFVPILSFLMGLGGSLHCVGMCGGLVTACSKSKIDTFTYQIARLLGYVVLGVVVGFIGKVTFESHIKEISLISAVFMGALFLFFGFKIFFKTSKMNLDFKWISSKYNYYIQKIFGVTFNSSGKPFFIGLFSVLLPCGLLYGTILSFGVLYGPYWGTLSMVTFWCGTLPALIFTPLIVTKFMRPVAERLPKIASISLIVLGIMTITYRVSPLIKPTNGIQAVKPARCH